MITLTRTYKDYKGLERTEEYSFGLTKADLMEMEMGVKGGYTALIKKIVDSKEPSELIRLFKDLVMRSYGVISDDGRRFQKNDEIRQAFVESPVYSDIFMELVQDDKKAAEFVSGIMPEELAEQAKAAAAEESKKFIAAQS